MNEKKIYRASLVHKTTVARDVLEFRLTKPGGFAYQAGQFVQFHIPQDNSFVLRSYSVACATRCDYLDFLLKVLPGGKASEFFSRLEIGGEVELEGPQGRFVCESAHAPRKVFVATGTGIAPIIAMLEELGAEKNSSAELSLLFGVHAEPDLFWMEKLEVLKRNNNNFSYQLSLSHPDKPESWTGLTGRVTAHLPQVQGEAEYYVCGNLEMIKDVRLSLTQQGVPVKNIHFEIF